MFFIKLNPDKSPAEYRAFTPSFLLSQPVACRSHQDKRQPTELSYIYCVRTGKSLISPGMCLSELSMDLIIYVSLHRITQGFIHSKLSSEPWQFSCNLVDPKSSPEPPRR